MRVHGRHHHDCENPWDEAPPWALEIGFAMDLIIQMLEKLMSISPEIQEALDEVRKTKSLVASVHAGIQVTNQLIIELEERIAALQAGQPLSADDKAAIVEQVADLKEVNAQLSSDIPAGTTQP